MAAPLDTICATRRDESAEYASEDEECSLDKRRTELVQAYANVKMEVPPVIFTMDVLALDAVLQVLLRLRIEQTTSRSLRIQNTRISRAMETASSEAGSKHPRDASPGASSHQSKRLATEERSLSAPSAPLDIGSLDITDPEPTVLPDTEPPAPIDTNTTAPTSEDVDMEASQPPTVGTSEWFMSLLAGIRQGIDDTVDAYQDFILPDSRRYVEVPVIRSANDVQMVDPETLFTEIELASRPSSSRPRDKPFRPSSQEEDSESDYGEDLTPKEESRKHRNERRDCKNLQRIQAREQQRVNTERNRNQRESGSFPSIYGYFAPPHTMPEVDMSHAGLLPPILYHSPRTNTIHGWRLGEYMRRYDCDLSRQPFSPNEAFGIHYHPSRRLYHLVPRGFPCSPLELERLTELAMGNGVEEDVGDACIILSTLWRMTNLIIPPLHTRTMQVLRNSDQYAGVRAGAGMSEPTSLVSWRPDVPA
jgi:hypothetical protein